MLGGRMSVSASILEALETLADVRNRGFSFLDARRGEVRHPFASLVLEARSRAGALQRIGIRNRHRVAMLVADNEEFVMCFLGAVIAGAVPIPLYPPLGGGNESWRLFIAAIFRRTEPHLVIASEFVRGALTGIEPMPRLITPEELRFEAGEPQAVAAVSDQACFLQFTSGSTGDPRGVVISNGNLAANARAIAHELIGVDLERDRGLCWLPLYHDMGLIGHVLVSLLAGGVDVVFFSPLEFVKRPSIWMEMASRYRATITFGPNFAFALAARRTPAELVATLDLSSLRVVGCGAEPIQASVVSRFVDHFASAGLSSEAIVPCYGLAESTLLVSFDRGPGAWRGATQASQGRESAGAAPAVSCGRVISGHELCIVDALGNSLPDSAVGEITLRGPSVASGYLDDPEQTRRIFGSGWLRTGDLGFIQAGRLFVTGRLKDVLFVRGRNVYPQELEWIVDDVPGVRRGNCACIAVEQEDAPDRLVVIAEAREAASPNALAAAVRAALRTRAGVVADDIVLIPPNTLPKTSSGKVRRQETRAQYLEGRLGDAPHRTPASGASQGART
jgi:fatty-acyl-CoA synthase